MNKELLELLDSINDKKAEVKKLVAENKLDEAKKAKDKLKEMQAKFDLLKDLDDEKVDDMKGKASAGTVKKVGGDVAVKEFADAARRGFHVENALSSGIREGSDPDGGYIVPEDIRTQINDWKQSEFSLESLISVEPVTTNGSVK